MVIVDSSALIPLSRIGELSLIDEVFNEVHTTEAVWHETVDEGAGNPGVSALVTFLENATLHETPDGAAKVAELEGIEHADASVVLLAEDRGEVLLANDKGLIQVARARGVECYWVTSLLFALVSDDHRGAPETQQILEELVEDGMTLSPSIFVQANHRIEELGEE